MDSAVTNKAVALALNYEIIPAAKADCHTHAEGVTYLYSEEGHLFRTVWVSPSGRSMTPKDEFSPATNPADALACLEEWCKANKDSLEIDYSPRAFHGPWYCSMDSDPNANYAGSFCEAACQAILAAEART